MRIIWWSGGAPGSQAVRSVRVLLRLRPRCCSGGLCGCGRAVVCSVVVPCVDWCSETPRCVGLSPRSPQARHRPTERRYLSGEIQTEQKTRKFLTSAGFPSVWCLSGVPEGLLIAGDHQTSTQTRGKSNSPPSRKKDSLPPLPCPSTAGKCTNDPGPPSVRSGRSTCILSAR